MREKFLGLCEITRTSVDVLRNKNSRMQMYYETGPKEATGYTEYQSGKGCGWTRVRKARVAGDMI